MTQKDKELLLQDLCSRLPYGVILNCCDSIGEKLIAVDKKGIINYDYDIEEVKPYLFPLSSMNEEQKKEFYDKYCWSDGGDAFEMDSCSHYYALEKFVWLNKKHFDYRGLIPMGLAIDATGLNIY